MSTHAHQCRIVPLVIDLDGTLLVPCPDLDLTDRPLIATPGLLL